MSSLGGPGESGTASAPAGMQTNCTTLSPTCAASIAESASQAGRRNAVVDTEGHGGSEDHKSGTQGARKASRSSPQSATALAPRVRARRRPLVQPLSVTTREQAPLGEPPSLGVAGDGRRRHASRNGRRLTRSRAPTTNRRRHSSWSPLPSRVRSVGRRQAMPTPRRLRSRSPRARRL